MFTLLIFQTYVTGTTCLNDKAMFEMLYYCGLRRSEARGLQWSDIDWNNKLVSITKQANSVKDSQKYYEILHLRHLKVLGHYLLLKFYIMI